jgi:hypothetical protein
VEQRSEVMVSGRIGIECVCYSFVPELLFDVWAHIHKLSQNRSTDRGSFHYDLKGKTDPRSVPVSSKRLRVPLPASDLIVITIFPLRYLNLS